MRNSILIIDNDGPLLDSLSELARTLNWSVTTAPSVAAALSRIHLGDSYDLVLLNYEKKLANRIESLSASIEQFGRRCTLLIMTASSDEQISRFCRQRDIPLLVKPFSVLSLLSSEAQPQGIADILPA